MLINLIILFYEVLFITKQETQSDEKPRPKDNWQNFIINYEH